MLFDDEARTKLDAIIHGAAIGETVGLLANRLSEAERAEKLTAEGILQLSRQSDLTSTTAELLKATIKGLEAAEAMGSPSNLDIRIHLHHAYREWVRTSSTSSQFRNIRFNRAIQTGPLGSLSSVEQRGCDGMLLVAPIGLAFSDDPGRAFQIGAETAALLDADFNSYLGAGVVSLLFALVEQRMTVSNAIPDILTFIRPVDWSGEISNVLRSVSDCEALSGCYSHTSCSTLHIALKSAGTMQVLSEAIADALALQAEWSVAALAGQLAGGSLRR